MQSMPPHPTTINGKPITARTTVFALQRNDPAAVIALWRAYREAYNKWPPAEYERVAILLQDDPTQLFEDLRALYAAA